MVGFRLLTLRVAGRAPPVRDPGRASLRGALVARAALLPLRAAGLAAGFVPLLWPFRLPQAGVPVLAVLGFAGLAPLAPALPVAAGRLVRAPLFGPAPLPLVRAPLLAACAPFRFPFELPLPLVLLAPFPLHRVPAAGRVSVPARRAGRPPVELCAGLRSRVCAAGLLKCGRAAAGLPLAAGFRTGVLRGTCVSAALCGVAGAAAKGFCDKGSGISSSRSYECMK